MKIRSQSIISDFMNYIEHIRRYSLHTIRSYKYDLNDYISFCYDFDPENNFFKLDQSVIQAYLQYVSQKGLSAKTLARRLASIKSLYKYMLKNKIVKVDIAESIKTPKINKELPHYLSLKEAEDILRLPKGNDEKSIREKLILELFYTTGIRISELVSIRFSDIRLEEGVIYVMGKGSKERIVMIGGDAQTTLRDYQKLLYDRKMIEPENYLFPSLRRNSSTGHIAVRTVFNIVKKYLQQVSDDEKLSPHSLRHTFATHMLNNGADLMAIKDLLGHSSLSSTQVYTHLQPERLKKIHKDAHPHGK